MDFDSWSASSASFILFYFFWFVLLDGRGVVRYRDGRVRWSNNEMLLVNEQAAY